MVSPARFSRNAVVIPAIPPPITVTSTRPSPSRGGNPVSGEVATQYDSAIPGRPSLRSGSPMVLFPPVWGPARRSPQTAGTPGVSPVMGAGAHIYGLCRISGGVPGSHPGGGW